MTVHIFSTQYNLTE